MRKAYITRYAAVGDHLHSSHLPRLLKEREGYDWVTVEYNPKGAPVYSHNPFIDEHILFDPTATELKQYPLSYLAKRHEELVRRKAFDLHINLFRSIEYGYIAMEDQGEYYLSSEERRAKYGGWNYYDQVSRFAGFPQHVGMVGELHFTEDQERLVQAIYAEQYAGKFVVIANLSGSSKHKLFYEAEPIVTQFLATHPDAVCITMGDNDVKEHLEFAGERVIHRAGVYPMKQSMLMAKYANLVIGAESGLMVAATLLGAPTVQLMTAASIKNHGGDFPNDRSLQSPIACSPCHKGPYDYLGCPTFQHLGLDYPACVRFGQQRVLERMEQVYQEYAVTRALNPVEANGR